ncbi:MAG: choline/carnitine O-acyltransferase [Chloroflexota bacterium]
MSTKSPQHPPEIHDATVATADDLMTILSSISQEHEHISELSLPEIEAVVDIVSRVIPAGNVPGLIASGLARLGRNNQADAKRDVNMLLRGMQQMLDRAVFRFFFAGPAQVIWGYQKLLATLGHEPDAAFPEGTWQFYVEYALREDTARFTIETDGFDSKIKQQRKPLADVDRMAAWVMTAIQTLHFYPALLENEWRERVYIRELVNLFDKDEDREKYQNLFDEWFDMLPYRRLTGARGDENYPAYRRRMFDSWLLQYVGKLNRVLRTQWLERVRQAKETELASYIRQMTIGSYLTPDQYSETRTPLKLSDIHVAVVHENHYYLIPICQADSHEMITPETVHRYVTAIEKYPSRTNSDDLTIFAKMRRGQWETVNRKLPNTLVKELNMLRLCPIILNFNPRDRQQPLSEIRQAERGIGNHALTIFDTRESIVFDQSHIYFDGTWAAALAEIMTNEAIDWARHYQSASAETPTERPYSPKFTIDKSIRDMIAKLDHVDAEVSAENSDLNFSDLSALRDLFKQRSDLLRLTVNDIFLLYRALHAMTYAPDEAVLEQVQALLKDRASKDAAQLALETLQSEPTPPAVLMPVDASRQSPRDRLHPMSFEVPLTQLKLLQLHQDVMTALNEYENGGKTQDFDRLQKQYLASLAGFGEVMRRAKNIANAGLSNGTSSIKLLAHLPTPLQHFLNQIPNNFDMLNDIIRGREVFSNVGQVAKESTLRRFITAIDDNEQKDMAWGMLTDADYQTVITARDFRPHVKQLIQLGHKAIAQAMIDDYLNAYIQGLNQYVADLTRITRKSREGQGVK